MKAKLKSFSPHLRNGIHETYEGTHGTLYKFDVVFENGTAGVANAKSASPAWSIGTEYTFETSENQYGVLIKSLKKVDDYQKGSGGAYSPVHNVDEAKNIAYQVAVDVAISYCKYKLLEVSHIDFYKIVMFIFKILEPFCTEKRSSIIACSAMKRSIMFLDLNVKFPGMVADKNNPSNLSNPIRLEDIYTCFVEMYNNISTNGGSMGQNT